MDRDEPDDWIEITELLREAASELPVGKLLSSRSFSLKSSLTALELMNPRMDSGCRNAAKTTPNPPIPEPGSLSHKQTAVVMDHLFSSLATWIDGHTLPQSVYSCAYMRVNRSAASEEWRTRSDLKAYTDLMDGLVAFCKKAIENAQCFNEEDYSTSSFGLQPAYLLEVEVLELSSAATEFLREEQIKTAGEGDAESVLYLFNRLSVLHGLFFILKGFLTGVWQSRVMSQRIKDSLNELSKVEASHAALSEVEVVGFDPDLHNDIMGSSPPRSVHILSSRDGASFLSKTLNDLLKLAELRDELELSIKYDLWTEGSKSKSLLQRITKYSRDANPNVLVRSLLKIMLLHPGTFFAPSSEDYVKNLLEGDIGPLSCFERDHSLLVRLLRGLIGDLCRNKGRQRRSVLHFLARWDFHHAEPKGTASGQLEKLNVFLRRIAVWSTEYHLLLGFDCNLYSSFEYLSVYNYLSYLRQNDNAAEAFFSHGSEMQVLFELQQATLDMIRATISIIQGFIECKGGRVRFARPLACSHGSKELQYDQRFAAAGKLGITPKYLGFSSFCDLVKGPEDGQASAKVFFEQAQIRVRSARQSLERTKKHESASLFKEEIGKLARVCVINAVELQRLLDESSYGEYDFEFVHVHFPALVKRNHK